MEVICQAHQAGDPALQPVIQRAGHYLAIAVANLISVVGVKRVLIAGSVACLGQALVQVIREELEGRALDSVTRAIEIDLSDMGQSMVVLGASALVLSQELGLFSPQATGI
jgi:predicted NBD/HSP70 family sugar kinase